MGRDHPHDGPIYCGICHAPFPSQQDVEAHIRDTHPEALAELVLYRDAKADLADELQAAYQGADALFVRAKSAETALVEIAPTVERALRQKRGRAEAAARSNRRRVGLQPVADKILRRAVRSLEFDEDGRRRSLREILDLLHERGTPIGKGGSALKKIAELLKS